MNLCGSKQSVPPRESIVKTAIQDAWKFYQLFRKLTSESDCLKSSELLLKEDICVELLKKMLNHIRLLHVKIHPSHRYNEIILINAIAEK